MDFDDSGFQLVVDKSPEAIATWMEYAVRESMPPMDKKFITMGEFMDSLRQLYGVDIGSKIASKAFSLADDGDLMYSCGQRRVNGQSFTVFVNSVVYGDGFKDADSKEIASHYKESGVTSDDSVGDLIKRAVMGARYNLVTITEVADLTGCNGVGVYKLSRAMEQAGCIKLGQIRLDGSSPLVYAVRDAERYRGMKLVDVKAAYLAERGERTAATEDRHD